MGRGVLLAILVAGLAGCSLSTPTTTEETVCTSWDQLQESVDAFRALDPATTSVDGYREAWVQVRDDFRELRFYRQDLAGTNLAELNTAVEELRRAVNSLPDDVPLADAVDSLDAERQRMAAAFAAIDDELNCPE
jgi:uncharacterized iron-regulated protein